MISLQTPGALFFCLYTSILLDFQISLHLTEAACFSLVERYVHLAATAPTHMPLDFCACFYYAIEMEQQSADAFLNVAVMGESLGAVPMWRMTMYVGCNMH